jgi:hypothetical protein
MTIRPIITKPYASPLWQIDGVGPLIDIDWKWQGEGASVIDAWEYESGRTVTLTDEDRDTIEAWIYRHVLREYGE